jgi:hypothetical protein
VLYRLVGEYLSVNYSRIKKLLLIAPPDRVAEFENDYGCTLPKNDSDPVVMARFAAPQLELELVYKELHDGLLVSQQSSAQLLAGSMNTVLSSAAASSAQPESAHTGRDTFKPPL